MPADNFIDKAAGFFDKGAETIDTVASGNIAEALTSFDYTKLFIWGRLILQLIIVLGIFTVIYVFFFKFNISVLVKKRRGNAIINIYDKGKITEDEKKRRKLVLFKHRVSGEIPDSKVLEQTKRGRDFLTVFLDDNKQLHFAPTEIIQDGEDVIAKIKPIPQDRFSFMFDEMKVIEQKSKKKGIWAEYKNEIILFITAMGCLGLLWITVRSWERSAMSFAAAVNELAKALASLK